jgi:hypothetical protein
MRTRKTVARACGGLLVGMASLTAPRENSVISRILGGRFGAEGRRVDSELTGCEGVLLFLIDNLSYSLMPRCVSLTRFSVYAAVLVACVVVLLRSSAVFATDLVCGVVPKLGQATLP